MSLVTNHTFRLRSFVGRNSRQTIAQKRVYEAAMPSLGLSLANGLIDFAQVFGRQAPCVLEIGFGSGQSLFVLAKNHPECNFIGIETHQPGIGSLLLAIEKEGLKNVRIYHGDAIDLLEQAIPNESLACIQIFFPDPWQKRRHHARRLIRPEVVTLLAEKLICQGELHLATDWDDYAKQMLRVVSESAVLINVAGINQFTERSRQRPIITKFEQRALCEGRAIWDLCFQKISKLDKMSSLT